MSDTSATLALPIAHYVDELSVFERLPVAAATLCMARYAEAGPLLRTALNRGADGRMHDGSDELLFFRASHIVHSIVAGMFDGDADALFEAIVDARRDPFIRSALLQAAAFLTWDGRIDRPRMMGFLQRFDSERLARDGDYIWLEWARTIACLGLRDMVPAMAAAAARGSIIEGWEREALDERLAEAERAPRDIARMQEAFGGYPGDAVAILRQFEIDGVDGGSDFQSRRNSSGSSYAFEPVVNPWRDVGRNDLYPCGSGKKAERCCRAAA